MMIVMNNKRGFSLLSFLIYLMLFSMIAFLICNIITSFLLPSLVATRKCKSLIALHIASDLFVREIREMSNKKVYSLKCIMPHELIWHTDGRDIGWCFVENRLERKEGLYIESWKNKKTSIVADGIAQATFVVEKRENQIIGIELTLNPIIDVQKKVICYVAIK